MVTKIKYGRGKHLSKQVREITGLNEDDLFKCEIGEQAHIIEGTKDNLEGAGYYVLGDPFLHVVRDGVMYLHQEGEKVFYKEDIEAIVAKTEKNRDEWWLDLVMKLDDDNLSRLVEESLK
jgi:hypothetical protein